ncbi:MAG: MoxR family ATPase [Lachnospiraceae bacterium]|nr:MoxR family ATPase [Lachnospiraceae bacterium]
MSGLGIRKLSVDHMVSMLSGTYISLIKNRIAFREFPSVMLWGPPGVGKSQGVRQIAEKIKNETGKNVRITDVRLLLFNPVDLRGIPTANEDKTLAVWLKPQIFQMDPSETVVNILFLDEITAAPTSVQAAAYQITLDRTVGEHKLPENCIVIAAGNRVTDRSVSYNMPKALANRLCHLEIEGNLSAWHKWAIQNDIHPFVVGFIEYNSSSLLRSEGMELAFPTPRSWEMVSNILNFVSDNMDEVFPMIVGCVGEKTGDLFKTWTEVYKGIPSVEDIFLSGKGDVPAEKELRIALKSAMVRYAKKCKNKELIDNSIKYSCKLPWSFRKQLLQDYIKITEISDIVEANEVYKTAVKDGLEC